MSKIRNYSHTHLDKEALKAQLQAHQTHPAALADTHQDQIRIERTLSRFIAATATGCQFERNEHTNLTPEEEVSYQKRVRARIAESRGYVDPKPRCQGRLIMTTHDGQNFVQ